jgi:translocation and assembly module TamB
MWRIKRVSCAIVACLGAALAIVLGLALWMLGDRSDRFLERALNERLRPFRLRVELEDADVSLWRRVIELYGVRLFPGQHSEPLLYVPSLRVRFSIEDLLAREFSVADLRLDRPQILITRDARGRPNFADIDLSALRRPRAPRPYTLRLGRVTVADGRLMVYDQRHRVHLTAEGIRFSLAPTTSASRAEGMVRQMDIALDENVIARAQLEWRAEILGDRLRLERARVAADGGDVLVAGTVRGWENPQYDLSLNALIHLDRLAENWPTPIVLSGDLIVRGRVQGQGRAHHLDATLTTKRAILWGIRVTHGEGTVRAAETVTDERARPQVSFGLKVREIAAAFLRAQGIRATGTLSESFRLPLIGMLSGRSAFAGPLPLEAVRARVRLESEHALIEDLDMRVLGGRARGYARIGFTEDSTQKRRPASLSEAHIRFENVSVRDLAAVFVPRPLPLDGTAQGTLVARWPGVSFSRASGTLAARIVPPTASTSGALPVRGALDATLSPRGLALRASTLELGRSRMTLSGLVNWNGDLDLAFDVHSDDMFEQQRVLDAAGYPVRTLTYGFISHLSGTADYRLRLAARKGAYVASGDGELKGISIAGERVRSLRARFTYAHGRWEIEEARLLWETGARAELALTATPDLENGLTLRGRLHRVSLDHWLKAMNLELPLSGALSGEIALSGLPGAPTGTARIALEDGEVSLLDRPLRFHRLAGAFHVAPPLYEFQDVRLDLPYGAIALSGSLRTDDGAYALRLRAEGMDLAPLLRATMGRPVPIEGRLTLTLSGHGTLSEPRLSGNARVERLSIAGHPAGEIAAELRTSEGRLVIPITATLFGQTHRLLGTLDLADPALTLRVRARLQDFSLTPYFRLARRLAEWGGTLSGEMEGDWALGSRANRARPGADGRATLAITSLHLVLNGYALQARHPFTVRVRDRRLTLEPVALVGENTSLELRGTIDLGEFFGRRSEGGHDVEVNGTADLRLLRGLYPGLFASGRATIRASLRGYVEEPRLSGLMEIEDLALRVLDWPVSLAHGYGRIRFTASQALIENMRAQVNEGEVTVSGGLLLRNLRADQWRIGIRSEAVVLTYPRGLRSIVDGRLTLQGNRQLQVLSGTMTVRRSEYTQDVDLAQLLLAQANERWRPTLPDVPIRPPLALDIRVYALDTVFVRNNLADAVASASLHIGGTLSAPRLSGNLIVTRGVIRFRNREYQITRGRVDVPRDGTTSSAPRFHLEAESDIAGYRVIVGFFGTLDRFQTTLRSEPALPPEQILSLIATGDISHRATLATTPQTGLGTAANLLIGELTHRAEEFTGKIFGINRFQIDPLIVGRGSDPTARLTVGRQITRNLSILYATNLSGPQEQVIIVEYRLSDRFSLVGTRDQDGNFSFDLRIRKRF